MTEKGRDQNKKKGLIVRVALNVLIMLAICCVLVWGVTMWLDVWTNHGEYSLVPDVKGMSYDVAVERLKEEGFVVELSDSVYDNSVGRGAVVNQSPAVGAKVKPGRLIYLTVNAFSPRSVSIPQMKDTSRRQAESILKGLGFTHVDVVAVPSEYKDLVLAVKRNGSILNAGARVPLDARIVLEVGAGMDDGMLSDSIAATDSIVIDHLDLL